MTPSSQSASLGMAAAICLAAAGCGGEFPSQQGSPATEAATIRPVEPANAVYIVEGRERALANGTYRDEDGVLTLARTVEGDMNGDNHADLLAVLQLDSPGSGVFFYVNVLLSDASGGWKPAGESFLGDRIRFDMLDIYRAGSVSALTGVPIPSADYGMAVVGYHIHAPEQAFTDEPAFYITKHWRVDDGQLVQIENY